MSEIVDYENLDSTCPVLPSSDDLILRAYRWSHDGDLLTGLIARQIELHNHDLAGATKVNMLLSLVDGKDFELYLLPTDKPSDKLINKLQKRCRSEQKRRDQLFFKEAE
jgi:hypothetical protein